MLQRIAARPLALSASLLLFPACDDGDDDAETDGSTAGSTSTTDATDPATTEPGTTDPGTTTGDGTTGSSGDESSTGSGSSSSGGSSSEGGSSSSSGGSAVGYADIEGEYMDDFGGAHILSADSWVNSFGKDATFTNTIEQVDDDARWVAGFSTGGLEGYERIDWDVDEMGRLRYCSGAIGQETLQDAIDAPPSDREDFDGTGCGGAFAWSILTPVE